MSLSAISCCDHGHQDTSLWIVLHAIDVSLHEFHRPTATLSWHLHAEAHHWGRCSQGIEMLRACENSSSDVTQVAMTRSAAHIVLAKEEVRHQVSTTMIEVE